MRQLPNKGIKDEVVKDAGQLRKRKTEAERKKVRFERVGWGGVGGEKAGHHLSSWWCSSFVVVAVVVICTADAQQGIARQAAGCQGRARQRRTGAQ